MNNVLPVATMAFMPSKAKIYQRDYDKDNYAQDLVIDNSSQFVIDILGTFRHVALRLSPSKVTDLFNGASHSAFEPISGESLIDMLGGDHKPTVSTLTNGGVASLREQTVTINDNTLEFYAIVNNAIKVATSDVTCSAAPTRPLVTRPFLRPAAAPSKAAPSCSRTASLPCSLCGSRPRLTPRPAPPLPPNETVLPHLCGVSEATSC